MHTNDSAHAEPTTDRPRPIQSAQNLTWLLLVALTPLWVNLWGAQPFDLPKAMLARTLIWLLAALALALTASNAERRRSALANPLLAPLGLLALTLLVTTATAVDWRLSLWGSYERSQGTITLVSYLLLCALAATHLHRLSRARIIVVVMAATTLPIAALSVAQYLGWNPLGLVSDARSPVYATLGRSNFVGAYLALLTPLTAALFVTTQARTQRVLLALLIAGQIAVIGMTWSRSALLAAATALALFVLLWQWPRLASKWRWTASAVLGLLVACGPLTVLAIGPRTLGSIAARQTIWQATLQLIAERPFVGYGADAFGLVFGRVYPPHLVYLQGRDVYVDRAHNILLDWTVTAGIPGLLAYLLVLAAFIAVVGKAMLQPAAPALSAQRRALLAAILAAVLGNITNTLVSFDVTATALATWLLMGMGVALAAPSIRPSSPPPSRRVYGLAGVLLLATVIAAWQFNGRPLVADVAARAAQRHMLAEQWEAAIVDAERAAAFAPGEPAHQLLLAAAHRRRAASDPAHTAKHTDSAARALAEARRLRPGDVQVWRQTAQFYAAPLLYTDPHATAQALAAYERALNLTPNDASLHAALGAFHLQRNDAPRAAEALRRAVALDTSHGEAYLLLAAAELALGRVDVALADYREAVRLLPDSATAYQGLAASYRRLGRTQEALQAAERAGELARKAAHDRAAAGVSLADAP